MYRNGFFDANGSLTRKDDGTNVHSYSYDFRNLMTDYDGLGSSNDSTYKYDAFSRRITKDVNGTKTAYFHDGLNVVAEYNGSSQLQRTYVTPGLDSNVTMTASGSTYYYTLDGLGSVRDLLDSSEVAQNSYHYFAFGRAYGTPTENVAQPFRYTGRAWDPESSLYYYRARGYVATTGRFGSRDPVLAGSSNLYLYVLNHPVAFADPLGLQPPGTAPPGKLIQFGKGTAKLVANVSGKAKSVYMYMGGGQWKQISASSPLGKWALLQAEKASGDVVKVSPSIKGAGSIIEAFAETMMQEVGPTQIGSAILGGFITDVVSALPKFPKSPHCNSMIQNLKNLCCQAVGEQGDECCRDISPSSAVLMHCYAMVDKLVGLCNVAFKARCERRRRERQQED